MFQELAVFSLACDTLRAWLRLGRRWFHVCQYLLHHGLYLVFVVGWLHVEKLIQ